MADNLGRGEFFAIDRRSFSRACALGLNAGVIYLTIARGAGKDHCISHWSINAIEQYTGISRPKAIAGLALLIDDGLIVRERAGTKPRYRIVSWQNIVGDNEGGKSGDQLPEYVWLPNALINGAADEKSPVSLVREMQDIRRLQLLIAMYDESDLPNEGGVRRSELFAKFTCVKVVERGDVTIWGFDPSWPKSAFAPGGSLAKVYGLNGDEEDAALTDFFEGATSLRRVGLFEFVPHAFESDDQDAEMIHSLCNASGESWEADVANAAHETAFCYLWPDKQRWVEETGVRLIPARAHMGRITILGIARLRYRPRTWKTAAWVGKSKERTAAFLDLYEELRLIAPRELHSSLQHKGDIKGVIKGNIKG